MTRMIETNDEAKHIAKTEGLALVFNRKSKLWFLRSHDATKFYASTFKRLTDISVDDFYGFCLDVAINTISPAQMDKVVVRAQYAQAQDDGLGLSMDPEERAVSLALWAASQTSDKLVLAVEHSIYLMRQEADEVHGSYWDHKQQVREAQEAAAAPQVDDFQPVDPIVTQALDAALIAQRRVTVANTLEAATERKCMQHIQSFLHMVSEGYSYANAWRVIQSRSTFGTTLMHDLYDRCLTAARSFAASVREDGANRMRALGRKLVEITPEVPGKPSLHLSAVTEDRLAFVVSNLTAEQAACLAEYVRNIKPV